MFPKKGGMEFKENIFLIKKEKSVFHTTVVSAGDSQSLGEKIDSPPPRPEGVDQPNLHL